MVRFVPFRQVMMASRWVIAGFLVLVAMAAVVYGPAAGGPYVWTDPAGAARHPVAQAGLARVWDLRGTPAVDVLPEAAGAVAYRSLAASLWWLEVRLWGGEPAGVRAASVALHLLSALLLWQLLRRLGPSDRWAAVGAWGAAALFLIHPIQVESVLSVSRQGDVLATALMLAAAVCWIRWQDGSERPVAWAAGSFVFAAGAMLAAPVAVVLPAGLALLAWVRGAFSRRTWLTLLPLAAMSGAALWATLRLQAIPWSPGPPLLREGERLAIGVRGIDFYLQQFIAPWKLAALYPRWPVNANSPGVWLPAAAVIVGLGLLIGLRRRPARAVAAAAVFFIVSTMLLAGWVNAGEARFVYAADSRAYVPAAAVFALIGAAAAAALRGPRLRGAAIVTGGLLLVGLTGLAARQSWLYRDRETLLRATVAAHPAAPAAEALADLLAGRPDSAAAAERLYRQALAAEPWRTGAARGLARVLAAQGKPKDAQDVLQQCLAVNPDDAGANELLADMVVASVGPAAYPQVISYYERAVAADPRRAAAGRSLATIYVTQGRGADAEAVLKKCVDAEPRDAATHAELAKVLTLERKYAEADTHFDVATALRPHDAEAFCTWGLMLMDARRPKDAERRFRQALQNSGATAKYHLHLGRALRDQGRIAPALNEFEVARTLDEQYALAYFEAGETLLRVQQQAEAESNFRAALHVDPGCVEARIALVKLLMGAKDAASERLYEGVSLLRRAVEDTHESDLSLLAAYADALARVQAYDQAAMWADKAIALGRRFGLSGPQMEILLERRQRFEIAAAPLEQTSESRISLIGTPFEMPPEPPLPTPPEPPVTELIARPLDLSRPPPAPPAATRPAQTPAAADGAGRAAIGG
jgi:tetratricopeptide (TPR) repeat protein